MAISVITITNLQSSGQLALSTKIDQNRQLQQTIAAGGSITVQDLCTLDELNRNAQIQALIAAGLISVTVTVGTSDIGGLPTEADIRARTSFPYLSFITDDTISAATPAESHNVTGTSLLAGYARGAYTFGTGTSSLLFEANRPGTNGNLISVELVDTGTESISVSGGALAGENTAARTITVNYDGPGNTNMSTANSLVTLVHANATAKLLVRVTSGGAGAVVASTAKTLAGGTGPGFKVYIGNIEQNVNAKVTDVLIPLQSVTLTGMVNGDAAALRAESGGTQTMPLSIRVVT